MTALRMTALRMTAVASLLRVVIADDEPLARDCIRLALASEPDVEVVAECGDGEDAVEAIGRLAPDLVFLDVQMPGLDGFGVIERVGADRMPAVVFVTAYDEHALRAFALHATDYVLKPFDDRRFHETLRHARNQLRMARESALGRRLAALMEDYAKLADTDASEAPPPPVHPAQTPVPPAGYVTRVLVRHGLEAELTRAVYYELAELALSEGSPGIWSDDVFFPLKVPE